MRWEWVSLSFHFKRFALWMELLIGDFLRMGAAAVFVNEKMGGW